MSKCVKFFKLNGIISTTHIQMKARVDFERALIIRDQIQKRFPNLWREGRERFYGKTQDT